MSETLRSRLNRTCFNLWVRTYVVSGAASGIGAATSAQLSSEGHRVIGIDLRDAEIEADLSSPDGRAEAVRRVVELAPGGVHGLVACAGIAGLTGVDPALLVSVNYFGAIALVEGLHDLLAASGDAGVVLLASNSITCQPGGNAEVASACLDGDESRRDGSPRRPRPCWCTRRRRWRWPTGQGGKASGRSGQAAASGSTRSHPGSSRLR
jgi:NAD(P)-dependent dehydrogenase (short-subunit alcohol dehydrogenase family)